ncbi:MAG: FHA domain-containing protein [Methylotenera sp.]|nr:FHA domain-containing protein [Oligoflexia bacterium]
MSALPILTITRNGETIRTQPLEGEASVGREEGCVIRLDDRAISRQHALIKPTSEGIQIEKKSDFAPMSINGLECTRAFLKEGDVISIGPYHMKYSEAKVAREPREVREAKSQPKVTETPKLQVVQPEKLPEEFNLSDGIGEISMESEATSATGFAGPEATSAIESSSASSDLELGGDFDEHLGTKPISFEMNSASPSQDGVLEVPSDVQGSSAMSFEHEAVDQEAKTKVQSPAAVDVKLVFPVGLANHDELAITQNEVSIGRGKDCVVVLNDKKSSRKNSVIRRIGLKFIIRDLDSANGTYVNGHKIIQEQELYGDDRIQIGDVEFEFKALSSSYARKQRDFMPVPSETPMYQQNDGMPSSQEFEDFNMPGQPQHHDHAGMPGSDSGAPARKGFWGQYDKYIRNFSKLDRKMKIRVVAIGLIFAMFLFFDDEADTAKKSGKKSPKTSASSTPGAMTFEMLTKEQQKYIENQHTLGFDSYKNKDYDKAIFEIRKIFAIIPNYKDSKEIERYAIEGKRKLEALEEEKRKKQEESQLKAKIAQLVEETRALMDKKKYDLAGELFSQILALDPDNQQVAEWKKILELFQENRKIQEQERQVQEEINRRAWGFYAAGVALYKDGKFHSAIAEFEKVAEVGASDVNAVKKSRQMIANSHTQIIALRDPVLVKAKEMEGSGDLPGAFQEYRRATVIDPPHPAGYAGMERIRGVLHERSKGLYTEAVLAESYSDFATAQKKYKELLVVAPQDDIYYERAQRKLANYFKKDEIQ